MSAQQLQADRDAVQRRTLAVLAAAQVLGGVGIAIGFSVAALLAEEVSGSEALAGLAPTAMLLGATIVVVPLSRIMGARGRRPGLVAGFGLGAIGATVAAVAGELDFYPLLLVGMMLFGGCAAAGFQARFAATDLASPQARARALSIVIWATTVGAVAGPNLADPAEALSDAVGMEPLAGPFLAAAIGLVGAAVLLQLLLRPDPLLFARAENPEYREAAQPKLRESVAAIRRSSHATYGVAAVALAHGVMLAVMTMTPVHIHDGGGSLHVVGLVLSIHITGMYAFSPLVGWISDRYGRLPTVALGTLILALALALAGSAPADATGQLALGLFALGLGWSCALVAGSTLLSEGVPEHERPGAQGAGDLAMQGCAAVGSALGGLVVGLSGYPLLAGLAAVPIVVIASGAVSLMRRPVAVGP